LNTAALVDLERSSTANTKHQCNNAQNAVSEYCRSVMKIINSVTKENESTSWKVLGVILYQYCNQSVQHNVTCIFDGYIFTYL